METNNSAQLSQLRSPQNIERVKKIDAVARLEIEQTKLELEPRPSTKKITIKLGYCQAKFSEKTNFLKPLSPIHRCTDGAARTFALMPLF